jgi:hypothetical protein
MLCPPVLLAHACHAFAGKEIGLPVASGFSCHRAPEQKKRRHKAGVKVLRQVSYRQETYRAVLIL